MGQTAWLGQMALQISSPATTKVSRNILGLRTYIMYGETGPITYFSAFNDPAHTFICVEK